jgi:hypothetical protein
MLAGVGWYLSPLITQCFPTEVPLMPFKDWPLGRCHVDCSTGYDNRFPSTCHIVFCSKNKIKLHGMGGQFSPREGNGIVLTRRKPITANLHLTWSLIKGSR